MDRDRFRSLIREKRKVPLRRAFQSEFHGRLQFFNENSLPDPILLSIEILQCILLMNILARLFVVPNNYVHEISGNISFDMK